MNAQLVWIEDAHVLLMISLVIITSSDKSTVNRAVYKNKNNKQTKMNC